MSLIRRPNPFGEHMSLRHAMDRLFEDSFVRASHPDTSQDQALALDAYMTADSFVVEAALPGVKPEDIEITVLGEALTISARNASDQSAEDDGYTYREIRRGSFARTVTLPTGLKSDAAASLESGLLRLVFAKAEEAQPRQIQIKPSSGGQAGPATIAEAGADHAPATLPPTEPLTEWKSTSHWQAGDQWQPDGQGNGQPRIEQAG